MTLIVISGKARAGKDTLGEILKSKFKDNYFTMAYANELKRRLRDDFDLSREQLYGDLKEVPDKRYRKKTDCDEVVYWTPREIMQFMGTDAFRAIDDNFWVNQLFKYIHRNNLKNIIITDGRFPSEIKAVKDRGGVHIRIEREYELEVHGTNHASETSLDNHDDADFNVYNHGTIEDLEVIAETIIKEIENGR